MKIKDEPHFSFETVEECPEDIREQIKTEGSTVWYNNVKRKIIMTYDE